MKNERGIHVVAFDGLDGREALKPVAQAMINSYLTVIQEPDHEQGDLIQIQVVTDWQGVKLVGTLVFTEEEEVN